MSSSQGTVSVYQSSFDNNPLTCIRVSIQVLKIVYLGCEYLSVYCCFRVIVIKYFVSICLKPPFFTTIETSKNTKENCPSFLMIKEFINIYDACCKTKPEVLNFFNIYYLWKNKLRAQSDS